MTTEEHPDPYTDLSELIVDGEKRSRKYLRVQRLFIAYWLAHLTVAGVNLYGDFWIGLFQTAIGIMMLCFHGWQFRSGKGTVKFYQRLGHHLRAVKEAKNATQALCHLEQLEALYANHP